MKHRIFSIVPKRSQSARTACLLSRFFLNITKSRITIYMHVFREKFAIIPESSSSKEYGLGRCNHPHAILEVRLLAPLHVLVQIALAKEKNTGLLKPLAIH